MKSKRVRKSRASAAVAAAALILVESASAGGAARDLSALSLEDLLKLEVSSVSRRDQKLNRTPAAAFVITRDDIARSGATSVPELLRMVPGLQVARVSSSQWAVSSRGFNSRVANKMLVMIDGRTVYNDLYSGVFWDQNDVLLEDVERIEVIRGPGATMWGANAVNGVINIITMKAVDTLGGLATVEAGERDRAAGAVRYGGEHGRNLQYRAFTKYFDRAPLRYADGSEGGDGWNAVRGGGRLDWQPGRADSVTVQGDVYRGNGGQNVGELVASVIPLGSKRDPFWYSGGFALGRWQRSLRRGDMAVQAYYNREGREEVFGAGTLHTLDFDFQHHLPMGPQHDLMWGAGYRVRVDHINEGRSLFFHQSYDDRFAGAFVQDEITFIPDRLVLTAGVKFEHNSYTGLETQPGLRLLWTPTDAQSLWASASRAVRMPSVQELDVNAFTRMPGAEGALPIAVSYLGNPDFRSEVLRAYEVGYRRRFSPRLWLDVAGFVNSYTSLATREQGTPYLLMDPSPILVVPVMAANSMLGTTTGVETWVSWTPFLPWRLQASHSWLGGQFHYRNPVGTPVAYDPMQSPRNTVDIRSAWDLTRFWSLDAELRYVSRLGYPEVPRYVSANLRLARKLGESAELSLGADDLLRPQHLEFVPSMEYVTPTQVRRAFYVKVTWKF